MFTVVTCWVPTCRALHWVLGFIREQRPCLCGADILVEEAVKYEKSHEYTKGGEPRPRRRVMTGPWGSHVCMLLGDFTHASNMGRTCVGWPLPNFCRISHLPDRQGRAGGCGGTWHPFGLATQPVPEYSLQSLCQVVQLLCQHVQGHNLISRSHLLCRRLHLLTWTPVWLASLLLPSCPPGS